VTITDILQFLFVNYCSDMFRPLFLAISKDLPQDGNMWHLITDILQFVLLIIAPTCFGLSSWSSPKISLKMAKKCGRKISERYLLNRNITEQIGNKYYTCNLFSRKMCIIKSCTSLMLLFCLKDEGKCRNCCYHNANPLEFFLIRKCPFLISSICYTFVLW
jgi:hypothetical protein